MALVGECRSERVERGGAHARGGMKRVWVRFGMGGSGSGRGSGSIMGLFEIKVCHLYTVGSGPGVLDLN